MGRHAALVVLLAGIAGLGARLISGVDHFTGHARSRRAGVASDPHARTCLRGQHRCCSADGPGAAEHNHIFSAEGGLMNFSELLFDAGDQPRRRGKCAARIGKHRDFKRRHHGAFCRV